MTEHTKMKESIAEKPFFCLYCDKELIPSKKGWNDCLVCPTLYDESSNHMMLASKNLLEWSRKEIGRI